MEILTRVCTLCRQTLPNTAEFFYRSGESLQPRCKECTALYAKKYYVADREKIIERSKKYYLDNTEAVKKKVKKYAEVNKDKIKTDNQKYYLDNKETIKETQRKYNEINKKNLALYHRQYYLDNKQFISARADTYKKENIEHSKEYFVKYRREHKEEGRIYSNNRRARKLSLPNTLNLEQITYLRNYFHNACAVCGSSTKLHLDHWTPLTHPLCPGTIAANTVLLCQRCNASKHNTLPAEWLLRKYNAPRASDIEYNVAVYFSSLSAQAQYAQPYVDMSQSF